MRCAKCGFDNNDNAKTCAQCGSFLDPDTEARKRDRKVVKLPSDRNDEVTTPSERPWEVRASRRATSTGSTGAAGKTPTPRRRTGSTGKIPAIKRPAHEGGKIPPEERAGAAGVVSAATTVSARRMPGDAAPVIIDDAVTDMESPSTTSRRNTRYVATAMARDGGSKGKRKVVPIIIALLLICCLVALALFMLNPGDKTRTVSFESDGGTVVGNQYVDENGQLERPANPTRPGYVFEGWYLDADYEEEASFPLDVTEDMTLYAKWKKVEPVTPTNVDDTQASEATGSGQTSGGSSANAGGSSSNAGASGAGGSGSASSGATSGGSSNSGGNAAAGSGSGSGASTGGGSGSGNSGSGSGSASNLNGPGVTNGKVNVSMVASNGVTLTGTVTLHDGYVIPDSSKKAYTVAELRALGLNDAELCIARNEPYARQGYSFRNPGLQAYFNARSWYHNTGWRGELPEGSAGYVTAHNLLTIAQQSSSAARWLSLRTY